jgi:hypothetical protein
MRKEGHATHLIEISIFNPLLEKYERKRPRLRPNGSQRNGGVRIWTGVKWLNAVSSGGLWLAHQ